MTGRGFTYAGLLVLFLMLTGACTPIESVKTTPEPSPTERTAQPTVTPSPSPTATPHATPSPTVVPSPTPTPTPTPEPTPSPSPTPEPTLQTMTETPCCGLFDWIDNERLLVFDDMPERGQGAWVVHVEGGERELIASGFGIPSRSGTIAFPEPDEGQLVTRNAAGEEQGRVANGGRIAWPSPDGSRVAWFENLPIRTPSSSVNRSVELYVAEVDSGERRRVLSLQAAEVHWLPDNRHLIVPARNLDFEQAGLWIVDTETVNYEVLYEELFIQAVRLSPDGARVAFMRTFNDDPAANGLWTMDLEHRDLTPVGRSGPYRWSADSTHLWLLEMTETGAGGDRLIKYDLHNGEVVSEQQLDGQVLNDSWEISPDGSYVAYWRVSDGQVVVESLKPGG